MLREYTTAGQASEGSDRIWEVLWLYLPDYKNEGNMNVIQNIPKIGKTFQENDPDPFWSRMKVAVVLLLVKNVIVVGKR